VPEYDISYGNFDVMPEVSTIRVFGFDERWALKAALEELGDGAWTVIDIVPIDPPPEPDSEPTAEEEVPDGTA